jgi:hypothetical protein
VPVSELRLGDGRWVRTWGTPGGSDGVYAPFHQEFRCYRARSPLAVSPRVRRAAASLAPQPVRRERWYPTDVTDAQWAQLDPLLPDPAWLAGRGGRREKHCRACDIETLVEAVRTARAKVAVLKGQ